MSSRGLNSVARAVSLIIDRRNTRRGLNLPNTPPKVLDVGSSLRKIGCYILAVLRESSLCVLLRVAYSY